MSTELTRGENKKNITPGWRDVAKNFELDSQLFRLNIPHTSWYHPTIRNYAHAAIEIRRIQSELTHHTLHHFYPIDSTPLFEGMLSVGNRTNRAEMILRGMAMMLEAGFGGRGQVSRGYIRDKIGWVAACYNLEVVQSSSDYLSEPADAKVEGIWNEIGEKSFNLSSLKEILAIRFNNLRNKSFQPKLEKDHPLYTYWRLYGHETTELWHTPPKIDSIEYRQKVIKLATRLGIQDNWLIHPPIQKYLSLLKDTQDLQGIFNRSEDPLASGLTPSVAERYKRCAYLTSVVLAIMEEGFTNQTINPGEVWEVFNLALQPYGLITNFIRS